MSYGEGGNDDIAWGNLDAHSVSLGMTGAAEAVMALPYDNSPAGKIGKVARQLLDQANSLHAFDPQRRITKINTKALYDGLNAIGSAYDTATQSRDELDEKLFVLFAGKKLAEELGIVYAAKRLGYHKDITSLPNGSLEVYLDELASLIEVVREEFDKTTLRRKFNKVLENRTDFWIKELQSN